MTRHLVWLILGLCCGVVRSEYNSSKQKRSIGPPSPPPSPTPHLPPPPFHRLLFSDHELEAAIQQALSVGHLELKEQRVLDQLFYRQGVDEKREGNNKKWTNVHQMANFRWLKRVSYSEIEQALVSIRATKELVNILKTPLHILKAQPNLVMIWRKMSRHICSPRNPVCPPPDYPYRTADGSCNNPENILWGMSNRPQKRYVPADYHDGVCAPRTLDKRGVPLPSPRLVSNVIHQAAVCNLQDKRLSAFAMQWGQNLDHDFIDTPTLKGHDGADITCCRKENSPHVRAACFPIFVPSGDHRFKSPCMSFVRSVPGLDDLCDLGIRDPVNQATSFIDASFLYGADKETMDSLRLLKGGLLKINNLGYFSADEDQEKCMKSTPEDYCMKSGDNRIHILPTLATVQVIYLREHNRIATILGKINPHWDDEIIFQETRKIVAAVVQHVAYTEYLPHILGPATMTKYGLYSTPKGFNTVYNPAVNPTTANGFGAAAYRFGHSMIPGEVFLYNHKLQQKAIKIEYSFNRPTALMDDFGRGADNICRWLVRDGAAKSDRFVEPGVRDNLFLDEDGESFDLAAVNIQRGRDHGIPGYNAWREWCGLPIAVHFGSGPGGLVDLHPDAAMLMSKLYRSPDDIDLYAAGLSERHMRGGSVGPTFACIIGIQFKEWKEGDRFWYENMFLKTGFTLPQLNQIKQYSMAKMTCRNMNDPEVTHNVFLQPSERNPLVPCDSLPDLNLNFWRQFPKLANPFVPETMLFTGLKYGKYV